MRRSPLKLSLLITIVLAVTAFAPSSPLLASSPPAVSWQKAIGGSGTDWFRSVQVAPDGGYIAAGAWGYVDSDEGPTKAYLVKTGPSGEVQWQKTIGSQKKSVFHSVLAQGDGYIAAGYTNAKGSGGFDAYLVKTDPGGNIAWERTFGGTGDDRAYSLQATLDGGYVLAGEVTTDPAKEIVDALLVKTDASGNPQWQKSYGRSEGTQVAHSVAATSDGGYVLGGFTAEQTAGSLNVYMVKTNSAGARSWEKVFGGADNDWAGSVVEASGGGYLLGGVSGLVAHAWRTNGAGGVTWEESYAEGMFHSAIETSDGDFLGVGYASMPGGSINAYAAGIAASSGETKWDMTFGGGSISSVYSAVQAPDGGCAIAGVTNAPEVGAEGQDGYLVKTGAFLPGPWITAVSPRSGAPGTQVTVIGSGFGSVKTGSSEVSFGDAKAAGYVQWTASRIVVKVPSVEPGVVRLTVTSTGVVSNGVDFTVTGGSSAVSFYFAEGYTSVDFQVFLCLGNSGEEDATADVTYMFGGAEELERAYAVPGHSRATVNVNEVVGPDREVSIRVDSDSPHVVAERPTYFDYQGYASLGWDGGHCAVGARSPAKKWYFAEGTTRPEFDEWITVLNPGTSTAALTFRYMIEGEGEKVVAGQVDPRARATFLVRDHVGVGKDVSLLLESDLDIVAERPVYFDYRGMLSNSWKGGHCTTGVNWPERAWNFAEGTTRAGFEQWLCLQNPNDSEITVDAVYMLGPGQGDPVTRSYQVKARERLTVPVNIEVGPEKDVSTALSSLSPFIAERPLYFDYRGLAEHGWKGGDNVPGAIASSRAWFFGEGYTGPGFEQWLCVQNPGQDVAVMRITYYTSAGASLVREWSVPARSRLTISVNRDVGPDREVSTLVESSVPVIVERPMYFEYGSGWSGGHTVLGYPQS